ncbi:MAG: hypothetical protein ACXVEF_40625 [Polyangiales bacterium]
MRIHAATLGMIVTAFAVSACGSAGTRVKGLDPEPSVFTKLEAGSAKMGWKSARSVKTGVELTVYAPGQEWDAFTVDGQRGPNNWGPIGVNFRCKPGPKDECKRIWNALSSAGNLGVMVE